ncbi:MAG: GntR family transcriptional regulator [Bacillaceae bacterium]
MFSNLKQDIPIYIQIAQIVEDNILKGIFLEEQMIPSTTEISVRFKINPATVGKGFNLLVDKGILYKKRGVGMFVCEGAKEKLVETRKEAFYQDYIITLLEEAKKINISASDIVEMIKRRG